MVFQSGLRLWETETVLSISSYWKISDFSRFLSQPEEEEVAGLETPSLAHEQPIPSSSGSESLKPQREVQAELWMLAKGRGALWEAQEALEVAEMASYTVFSLLRPSVSFYFLKVLRSLCLLGYSVGHAGSWFPDQGSNPSPLPWKRGALTTGPPGKSLVFHFKFFTLQLLKPYQVNSFSTQRHWLRVFEWLQERI